MARWIATVNSERDFDIERAVSDLDVIYWGKYDFTFESHSYTFPLTALAVVNQQLP